MCLATVHVHLLPLAVELLPDPGFTAAGVAEGACFTALDQACVAENHGVVAEPAQVGASHGHPGLGLFALG